MSEIPVPYQVWVTIGIADANAITTRITANSFPIPPRIESGVFPGCV